MTQHHLYDCKPALFLTRFRGRIVWIGREEDDVVAGWMTSYRVALVALWNPTKQLYEIASKVCLN